MSSQDAPGQSNPSLEPSLPASIALRVSTQGDWKPAGRGGLRTLAIVPETGLPIIVAWTAYAPTRAGWGGEEWYGVLSYRGEPFVVAETFSATYVSNAGTYTDTAHLKGQPGACCTRLLGYPGVAPSLLEPGEAPQSWVLELRPVMSGEIYGTVVYLSERLRLVFDLKRHTVTFDSHYYEDTSS